MKVYSQKEIRDLRRKGRVTDTDGKKLKPALFHKKPKAPLTPEERQAKAIEQIPIEIEKVLKSNKSTAMVLLEMIRKIKAEPVRIPEYPEPAKAWEHTITERDSNGKAVKMRSEAI